MYFLFWYADDEFSGYKNPVYPCCYCDICCDWSGKKSPSCSTINCSASMGSYRSDIFIQYRKRGRGGILVLCSRKWKNNVENKSLSLSLFKLLWECQPLILITYVWVVSYWNPIHCDVFI